jgi:hypothetical protein
MASLAERFAILQDDLLETQDRITDVDRLLRPVLHRQTEIKTAIIQSYPHHRDIERRGIPYVVDRYSREGADERAGLFRRMGPAAPDPCPGARRAAPARHPHQGHSTGA